VSGSALNLNSSHAFRYVLDAVPVACWIHSDGVVRYANPALARLLGVRSGETGPIVGRRATELLPAQAHSSFYVRVSRLLSGDEVPRCEEELTLIEGGSVAVEVVSTVVPFEGDRMILSFLHDITEQRRAERALRASEHRYRRLVDGQVVGVIEFTMHGIELANEVFLTLIGRGTEELPGGRVNWRMISPPEDEHLVRHKLGELLATGECKPFEKDFLRPDGSRVPTLLGASLLEREPEWRAVALVIDQTDRRKLQEMQDRKARLEALGVLAGGMAHNLNNILTGVIGNASLMLEHQLIPRESRAGAIAGDIIQSGERAAALTAQLLAYAGQGRFLVAPTDLRHVIGSQTHRVRAELPPNVRLTVEIPGELPTLLADAEQLRRLVTALLDNAIEAIGEREGGAVTVRARVEHIAHEAVLSRLGEPLPAGDYCLFEVHDNGAGMDTNTLAHAFDPFFSTKFPGRGLGLAAVAGMVRASRGAIRVNSSPGVGSVFQVYLPVVQA
jgi:PAS domain S-box-containing protein